MCVHCSLRRTTRGKTRGKWIRHPDLQLEDEGGDEVGSEGRCDKQYIGGVAL